jgi:hypothetical protein
MNIDGSVATIIPSQNLDQSYSTARRFMTLHVAFLDALETLEDARVGRCFGGSDLEPSILCNQIRPLTWGRM